MPLTYDDWAGLTPYEDAKRRKKQLSLNDDDIGATAAGIGGTADTSEADAIAQKAAYRRDMLSNVGVSSLLQGAQIAAGFIPTAADKRNKAQLEALEAREAAGTLGLERGERQFLERQMLNPARAIAAEQQLKGEALQASLGDATSAADLARVKREGRRDVQELQRKAGLSLAQEDLAEKRRELAELEQRTEYKAQRQAGRIDNVVQGLAEMGGVVGTVRAARAVEQLDLSGMAQRGYTPEQIESATRQIEGAKSPRRRAQLLEFYNGSAAAPTSTG